MAAEYGLDSARLGEPVWRFVVAATVTAVANDASAVMYDMELVADGEIVTSRAVISQHFDPIPRLVEEYAPTPGGNPFHEADEICVFARAIDAAGNASEVVTECIAGVPFVPNPLGGGAGPMSSTDEDPPSSGCRVGQGPWGAALPLIVAMAAAGRRRD